jgi:magnesium-transporting ATPase (P-type)
MNSNQQRDYLTPNTTYLPPLPNATISLVMGILSIVICGVGLVLGIIGLVMANKDLALFNNQPGVYSVQSFNNTKTGRICSIIGIILSALFIIIYAGILIFAFSTNMNDFK